MPSDENRRSRVFCLAYVFLSTILSTREKAANGFIVAEAMLPPT